MKIVQEAAPAAAQIVRKLIISAIMVGIYTALMALIPTLKHTSFHDITVTFEVWILFGIIIIMNSKSAVDLALKCLIFFLYIFFNFYFMILFPKIFSFVHKIFIFIIIDFKKLFKSSLKIDF